jgi:hypothetical protein
LVPGPLHRERGELPRRSFASASQSQATLRSHARNATQALSLSPSSLFSLFLLTRFAFTHEKTTNPEWERKKKVQRAVPPSPFRAARRRDPPPAAAPPRPEVSAPARRSVPQRPLARRFPLSTYLPTYLFSVAVSWSGLGSGGFGAGLPVVLVLNSVLLRGVLLSSGGAVGVSRGFWCRPSSVVSGGAAAMRFPGRILRISAPKCGCSRFFFPRFFSSRN